MSTVDAVGLLSTQPGYTTCKYLQKLLSLCFCSSVRHHIEIFAVAYSPLGYLLRPNITTSLPT